MKKNAVLLLCWSHRAGFDFCQNCKVHMGTIENGKWSVEWGLYWVNTCVPGAERYVSWVDAKHTSAQKVRLTEKQNKRVGEGVSLEISNCLAEPTHGDFCRWWVMSNFHTTSFRLKSVLPSRSTKWNMLKRWCDNRSRLMWWNALINVLITF